MILKDHLPQIYIHNDRVVYGLQCDLTGLGVIQYTNGRVDLGWFQNGSLNGKGKIIFKSGDIYDGLLKNGFFQGQGFYLNYKQICSFIYTIQNNQLKGNLKEIKSYQFKNKNFYILHIKMRICKLWIKEM